MCEILKGSRSHFYKYKENLRIKDPITNEVKNIFRDSKKLYGTEKLKLY